MKKKTKRFLLVIIFLVIPAFAIAGYTFYSHFEGKFYAFKVFFEEIAKKGFKGILFPTADNEGALDNEQVNIPTDTLEDRVPVTVFKSFITGFRDSLPALGSLKGHRETKLGFEKAGIVELLNFKEGDLVAKGALICSLNKQESLIKVRHAESRVEEAKSNLSLADNKLQRMTKKYQIGGTSKSLYEEALLEYERSTHTVEIAKIDVENAKLELAKCDIFAPYEGLIGNKYVEIGETITPNTLVCDLIDVDYMIVQIGVVERDIEKIKVGQHVSIFVDAYPDREFLGKVEMLSPIVEGQSRTFSVEIKVANPQKLLLPGMFARVKINVFEKKKALIIPSSALVRFRNKVSVFVVNEQTQIVNERPVSVTYSTTDYAVIDRGLKAGELVVVGDQHALADGTPVRIAERQVPEI